MRLFSAKCLSVTRLDGKTAIITGSNTGIGKLTVQDFFKRGARVIMACRNIEKANIAATEIKEVCKNVPELGELAVVHLDLTSLNSVRSCAQEILEKEKRIDLLVNNAGVMVCPEGKTQEGFETQFGTNHLGHFLFTILLLPKMIESRPSRIVNVSSKLHHQGRINFSDLNFEKRSYSALQAYAQSKLANILFTKELASRIQEAAIDGVNVYSLHPGVIATELGRHLDDTYFPGLRWMVRIFFGSFILKTPEQGAQTTIYCAVDENAGKETGHYYIACQVAEPSPEAKNAEDAKKLWNVSLKLVGLNENYNPFSIKSKLF